MAIGIVSKVKVLILGIFLGFLVTYNWILHDIKYRISFYGYKMEGNNPCPVIVLRKMEGNSIRTFHPRDRGIEVSQLMFTEPGQTVEFNDKQVNGMIKERYCK